MLVPFFNYLSMAVCVLWRPRSTSSDKPPHAFSDDEETNPEPSRAPAAHTFKCVARRTSFECITVLLLPVALDPLRVCRWCWGATRGR